MITEKGADENSLEEVDPLCKYFDGIAGLIAPQTGDAEGEKSGGMCGGAGGGSR